MASWKTRLGNGLLNTVLVAGSLAVVVLLYALGTRAFFSSPSPERPSDTPNLVGSVIQVEVRNGDGTSGLAAQTTRYLRERGFDVVDTGNHSSFDQEQSVVIDRVGNPEAARKVAEALGLSADRVHQDVRPQYYLDASVIIGHDYNELRPFQ